MDNGQRRLWLSKLALLTVAFLWGTSLTVVKQASSAYPPNFILGLRFTVATLILAVVFFKRIKNSTLSDWKNGGIIGFFLFVAYSSQTIGVSFAAPGRSGFLSASYCVIVPFLYWAVKKYARTDTI